MLLGITYSRSALRALLGEALTEAEFVEIKRHEAPSSHGRGGRSSAAFRRGGGL